MLGGGPDPTAPGEAAGLAPATGEADRLAIATGEATLATADALGLGDAAASVAATEGEPPGATRGDAAGVISPACFVAVGSGPVDDPRAVSDAKGAQAAAPQSAVNARQSTPRQP